MTVLDSPDRSAERSLSGRAGPLSLSVTGEVPERHRDRATRVWLFSSIFWLTFVDLVGLVMATELVSPNVFGEQEILLFSRLRPIHVNGVIFAWLSMMYLGGIFYILPRLTGTKLWSAEAIDAVDSALQAAPDEATLLAHKG